MKLLTRVEKRNPKLFGLYNEYVKQGMKPERAVDRAREECAKEQEQNLK